MNAQYGKYIQLACVTNEDIGVLFFSSAIVLYCILYLLMVPVSVALQCRTYTTPVAENYSSHISHSHPPSHLTSSHTSYPHRPSLLPTSSRRDKLLAVRTLFQETYRAAVPEVRPQGAVAFATGLLSRLTASFSGGSDIQT